MRKLSTKRLILAALLAALTAAATLVIRIPTPLMGYIHPGDGLVLLCGLFLGPLTGALAAGIGSMFADLLGGYLVFAPATLVIKALSAWIAGAAFRTLRDLKKPHPASLTSDLASLTGACIQAEAVMVLGYFAFSVILAGPAASGLSTAALQAGIAAAAADIPFNLAQGILGVILAAVLYPVLKPLLRELG